MSESRTESITKLQELIEGIDFCMLTTIDGGHLRSRPMSTQQFEFDGDLWFFTNDNSHKIEEIEKDNRVNVRMQSRVTTPTCRCPEHARCCATGQRSRSFGARS